MEAVIQTVPRHVPVGGWLARNADVRYGRRVDKTTSRGTAGVLDITAATEPVGEPRYRSEGFETDALGAQYVSDIWRNEQDPVPTGLQGESRSITHCPVSRPSVWIHPAPPVRWQSR